MSNLRVYASNPDSDVGDGAKPDFLPEQNQTVAQRLNSAWIQGQMALGVQ